MLSSGCKARFTASESSPEQRSISRSISFGVTIIFASSAGSFVLLPDTSRASVFASTTVGTPTDSDRDAERFSVYLGAGIANTRAGDYSAVRYLNCASRACRALRAASASTTITVQEAQTISVRVEQQLACFDSHPTEHSGAIAATGA